MLPLHFIFEAVGIKCLSIFLFYGSVPILCLCVFITVYAS
jgi:hypothetical protein